MAHKPPPHIQPNSTLDPKSGNDMKTWRESKSPEYLRYLKCKAADATRAKRIKVTLPKFNCLTPELDKG